MINRRRGGFFLKYRRYLPAALAVILAAAAALLLSGALTSRAVQDPSLSLDLVTLDNVYDETTNSMSLGSIDGCLETASPGSNASHAHSADLVIQNVEDLVGWQARLNYIGDQMRPSAVHFGRFVDTPRGQNVSFVNLPIDQVIGVHRQIVTASNIPAAAAEPQSAIFGSVYFGVRNEALSPDTPAKSVPDDTSYGASGGGVLATLTLEVAAGNAGNPSLFVNIDDAVPNPPGSDVVIFTVDRLETIHVPAANLGDAYHGEGAACVPLDCSATECPATPSPTPTPDAAAETPTQTPAAATPTPPPTATPTRVPGPTPSPRGVFDPQLVVLYSGTEPRSHPDITSGLSLGLGPDFLPETPDDTADYNLAGAVTFASSAPRDADIPDGALLGTRRVLHSLGALNNPCNVQRAVEFTFMEATTDINNTVEPPPYGRPNELDMALLAGDLPPFDGKADIDPPPAVTQYPSFLNAIFDPDWVDFGADKIAGNADDTNGPLPPIKPRSRSVGVGILETIWPVWQLHQELVFEPGTKLPNLPAFDPSLGYPTITVLQMTSIVRSATPPLPSIATDFCTPLADVSVSYGVTRDHESTAPDESGIQIRTLADAGSRDSGTSLAFSRRDADRDGFENLLDPCPFHADHVWNPRFVRVPGEPMPGDGDRFIDIPVGDGIPDTCDPTPLAPTSVTGGQPTDHDGDGSPNSADNCPLHFNPGQSDRDVNAAGEVVGDDIGDVCDTAGVATGEDCLGRNCDEGTPHVIPGPRSVAGNGPDTPDGLQLTCLRVFTITAGGPSEATVSGCSALEPGPAQGTPTPTPTPPPGGTPTPPPATSPSSPSVTPTLGGLPAAFATPAVTPTVLAVALPPTGGGSPDGVLAASLITAGALALVAAALLALRFVRPRNRQ